MLRSLLCEYACVTLCPFYMRACDHCWKKYLKIKFFPGKFGNPIKFPSDIAKFPSISLCIISLF